MFKQVIKNTFFMNYKIISKFITIHVLYNTINLEDGGGAREEGGGVGVEEDEREEDQEREC